MKLQISLSAVPLAIVKKYMRKNASNAVSAYDEIFNRLGEGKKEKYRIYLPLDDGDVKTHKVTPPHEIVEYLTSLKFTLNDYLLGTAIMPDGKRIVRLGKILSKKPELLKMFENDPQRKLVKTNKMWVVISRHPYDILGMSFDRGWTSCMDLHEGINKHYLKGDLKRGTLVAYLIRDTDKNINNPISRIAIRPFFDVKTQKKRKKNIYLVPSNTYGTASEKFESIVRKFCKQANANAPHGHYVMPDDLYDDGDGNDLFHIDASSIKTMSEDECAQLTRQQSLEPEIIEALVERGDYDIVQRLVNFHMKSMDDKTLIQIASNRDWARIHSAMCRKQKGLSLDVLLALANSPDEAVLNVLAKQTTRVEILDILSNSTHSQVRESVADNPVATDAILTKLADDTEESVLCAVMNAENISTDLVKYILIHSKGLRLTKIAVRRSDIPIEILLPLIEENLNSGAVCEAATKRRALPVEMIRKIYDKAIENAEEWDGDAIMQNICSNPNTPLDLIQTLASSSYHVARQIIRRKDTTNDMIDGLLLNNAGDFKVASAVLSRPEVTFDQMKLILSENEEEIIYCALDSGHMSDEASKFFVEEGEPLIQARVARRINPYHPVIMAIAKFSTYVKALRNLVDYNEAEFSPELIEALMNNPVCLSSKAIMYCLYYRIDKQSFEKLGDKFAPYLTGIEDFAADEGRETVAQINERRARFG